MTSFDEKALTDWFAEDVSPAHIGWYEKEFDLLQGPDAMQFWDGAEWRYGGGFNDDIPGAPVRFPRRWRGLRSPA